MSIYKKAAFAAVLAVTSASSVALANPAPEYVLKRIPRGPRPDQYVLVRASERTERPYALTGRADDSRRTHRAAVRTTPSHPKGPHSAY
jgi:hypothetical protein